MPKQPVRIGVVGAGQNTRARHIPGLQAIDGVKILSVCNRRPDSTRRAADDFNIPKQFADWQQLVADPDIDAVVIGTWPYLHCPITLAALAADKHVLCEARLAMNADEARQMLVAARTKPRLTSQVVPAPMTLEVDRTVTRLLDEGFLGDVLAIRVQAGRSFLDRTARLHWRQDARLSGLNILSLGIWYECLMRWVGEARQVLAKGRVFVSDRVDEQGSEHCTDVPEHLDVIAQMHCGAQASFQVSAVTGLNEQEGIWLFGEQATLAFHGGTLRAGRRGDAALQQLPVPREEAIGWRVEEEFIGAIRGEETIERTTFDDGLRYMQFTEAVHQSMRSEAPAGVEAATV